MCVSVGIDRADELGRLGERGIVRVDLCHGEHRGERLLEGQQVAQFLLDQVTDHALGLCTEDVEWVRRGLVVRRCLQRE